MIAFFVLLSSVANLSTSLKLFSEIFIALSIVTSLYHFKLSCQVKNEKRFLPETWGFEGGSFKSRGFESRCFEKIFKTSFFFLFLFFSNTLKNCQRCT